MGALKYRDPATQTWLPISTVGPAGPPGPTGPVGPPSGGTNVILLVQSPDVLMGTANTLGTMCTGSVHIKPDSWYMLTAGIRCIADLGAAGNAQIEVSINGVKVPTHTVMGTAADEGLWGGFTRVWVRQGTAFTGATGEGDYTMNFKMMLSAASKTIYSPEMALIELNDPNAITTATATAEDVSSLRAEVAELRAAVAALKPSRRKS